MRLPELRASGNSVYDTFKALPGLLADVLPDNYGNQLSKPVDTWVCVDWTTGKTLWTQKWYSRGSIISADGMLYIYEEKSGHVALVKPGSKKLDIISEFQSQKERGHSGLTLL